MTTPHWFQRVCHRAGSGATDTSDAGFTLIEALVSFVIFATVATTAAMGINNALNASHVAQQRIDAADVAQFFISDAIRRANTIPPVEGKTILSNVSTKDSSGQQHAQQEQFTVIETVRFDVGSCNSGRLFTVNVEVHQAQTNRFLARSDARVACPRV
jgi:type II secretory pathway pseudopilin PulG